MQKGIQNSSDFYDSMRPLQACPVCHKEYDELHAVLLDHSDDTHLIHIECPSCDSRMISLLTESNAGITSLCVRTELTAEEVVESKNRKKVDINHILRTHDSLDEGTFCKQLMSRSYGNESNNSR